VARRNQRRLAPGEQWERPDLTGTLLKKNGKREMVMSTGRNTAPEETE
jgi:hypothetical protein